MNKNVLIQQYINILSSVTDPDFIFCDDKYSGIFLPIHFDAYETTQPKVMVIGRETAGWNTNNKKNTIQRIVEKNKAGFLNDIIEEAFARYDWHLKTGPSGYIKKKHQSHFKRYYQKISQKLGIVQDGMIYANLLAWDYDKKSPLNRPPAEFRKIKHISIQLLEAQIRFFKPEYIVFATGYRVDNVIKELFNTHFNGYRTTKPTPKKFCQFEAANATCFRIAHPRVQNGNAAYRDKVISTILSLIQSTTPAMCL